MNIAQIECNVSDLIKEIVPESFIYDLLLAYGLPKASIARLKTGNLNLSKRKCVVSWKKKVLFHEELKADLHTTLTELHKEVKNEQRFAIVTDYKTLIAIDTKTGDKLDITIGELNKHFDFFLPWAGMEKSQIHDENPADVKAAEKMAKLFDEIKRDNPDNSPEFIHNLNVFLSRLLFCYFAEDTNIFEKGQFTSAVSSHTQQDGSDLASYLDKLFTVLNTSVKDRTNLPLFLSTFPYVNGGLFRLHLQSPFFTRRSRLAIIDCGDMDWSTINPDIFGSMIQAVVTPENRGGLGMHYTSVPNIMKVIKPLFLDELYEEFEKAIGNQKKLNELLERIYKIKIFDPACGSGNFLIIAYKELRKLEMAIFKAGNAMPMSRISLGQFYGIEIDDFAHEIAQLSLWLAEHQMNVEFYREFGKTNPTLPLREAGKIVHGNACRLDWEEVCPKNDGDEIYILGNPPYLGYSRQSLIQKKDMEIVFDDVNEYGKLDYITCWFSKGSKYISNTKHKLSFVSTNSICQGIQVALLWPLLFKSNIEIFFAHTSFKWENNAKNKAGVYVVILGLRVKCKCADKKLFVNGMRIFVDNINPYLVKGKDLIVTSRDTVLSGLLPMVSGLKAGDDGNLLLSFEEKEELIKKYPEATQFIKKYVGAKDFMDGIDRYCIWVRPDEYIVADKIEPLHRRFEKLKEFRLNSKKIATQKKAVKPFAFDETNLNNSDSLLIPQTGSERRNYLPIGFMKKGIVISNGARVIYNATPWLFSLLSSKMHIVWIRAVAGRLKMDMQYSNTLCYNTEIFSNVVYELI